jgi:hypothetical protein
VTLYSANNKDAVAIGKRGEPRQSGAALRKIVFSLRKSLGFAGARPGAAHDRLEIIGPD